MERMMCSREPPWLLGLLLIGRANFVARIICSRRPLSQRPIYSSVRPIVSGVEPRGYALAVSKKNTPLSNALSIIAREVGSSHWFPKVIVPRQIFETCSPVRPRYVTFILSYPSMYAAARSGLLLFVADLFHPVGGLAVETFLNGEVRHGRGWRGAVPMFLTRLEPDHVTRPNFLDRTTPALDPAAASRHDQGLAQRVAVPCGPSAGLERDTCADRACRLGCLEQGVNAYRAGKILGRSFAGRL